MIQEPQQQEIIEIPTINSMSTTVNSTKQNQLLNTKNPNNSQKTILKIAQPKNSKPRIFLLTRPAKSRLVRLETQTVQPHHQRNLNSSQLHHPQSVTTATPVISQKYNNNTKIIRIPFLPRSQLKTFSVKSNTNQVLKKEANILTNQVITKNQLSTPNSVEISSDQLQTQETSVKNTRIAKSTVNYLNLSENKNQIIQTQVQAQAQTQKPLTLASMAGIELTGADMSLSQADMSGAMPPTATVEEINVPVFIDEYLQDVHRSTTLNNNNTNNNYNNNNTISNNNNNHSNGKGNEVNQFLETLENFDFDINLLTDHSGEVKETELEVQTLQQQQPQTYYQQQQQQQQTQLFTEVDDNKNLKQHQIELQMMLDDILFNNNNNNNNNITTSNNNNNSTTSTNNNKSNTMESTDDFAEFLKCAPSSFNDDFLDDQDMSPLIDVESAVNIDNINNNEFSLSEMIMDSQQDDIMFTAGCSQLSHTSSQTLLATEIANAEPYVHNDIEELTIPTEAVLDMAYINSAANEENIFDVCSQSKLSSNNLKRNSSQSISTFHMPDKRLKLDLSSSKEYKVPEQPDISTPNIIEFLEKLDDVKMPSPSYANIMDNLKSSSNACPSIKSEYDDATNDYSPPNSPFSYNSYSTHTNCVNTAPNSPASSIATTTNASITTKRGRGRPAKTHSDIPDRSQIEHLSESEQKKILERAKNNEASRKSRLKHKQRDNALEQEEIYLKNKYEELQNTLDELTRMEKKLKKALRRQIFEG